MIDAGMATTAAAGAVVAALTLRSGLRFGLQQNWPRFVASGRLDGDVPVVMYHDVEPDVFARELDYLAANGYEPIDLDALCDWLDGAGTLPERPIVLTFDDGHASVYRHAYPLLRARQMRATVFLCPWWIPDGPEDHCRARRHPLGCGATWDQLLEMHGSGVLDVQAHSYSHHRVWIDSHLQGFARPAMRDQYVLWRDDLQPTDDPGLPAGWPLLPADSRLGHRRRFLPEREPLEACAAKVAAEGGAAFFERSDWRAVLERTLGVRVGSPVPGRFETADAQRAAIHENLSRTREILESRFEKPIRHLAFPWNEAGSLTVETARLLGYRGAVRRIVNLRDVCRLGDDPFQIPRVPNGGRLRFVCSLPGVGRRGALRVLVGAAARRIPLVGRMLG